MRFGDSPAGKIAAELLSLPVAPRYLKEYHDMVFRENRRRAVILSLVLLTLIAIFFTLNILNDDHILFRNLNAGAILGLCGILILLRMNPHTDIRVRQKIVFSGALLMMTWAGLVATVEAPVHLGYPSLTIGILIVGIVLYFPLGQLLALYAVAITAALIMAHTQGTSPLDQVNRIVFFSGLVSVAFVASCLIQNGRAREFSNHKKLIEAHARLASENRARETADRELRRYQIHLQEMVEEKTSLLEETNRILHAEIATHTRAREELRSLNLALNRRAQDLAQANEELKSFAYTVSHDLRAPLRAIGGFSQILLEEFGRTLDEKARTYLDYIIESVHNMNQLIEGLLRFSRVTREELQPDEIDLSDLARSVIDQLKAVQPQRIVTVTLQENLRTVADAALIRTVLENLLGNAWKFTLKTTPACIEFGARERGNNGIFYVKDNGAGFDMHYANRLFTPFQRLHKAGEFAGTGIGLSIVQRIIRRHGGEVWAEAQPGAGATFYFTIPPPGDRPRQSQDSPTPPIVP